MAAPNLLSLTTATGKTLAANVVYSAGSNTTLLAGTTGQVYKINTVVVSNIDGSAGYDITMYYYNGSVAYPVAYQITVPAKSTLVLFDKSAQIYLEETHSLQAGTTANNKLTALVSYEILS
jgi:hypothetical protein